MTQSRDKTVIGAEIANIRSAINGETMALLRNPVLAGAARNMLYGASWDKIRVAHPDEVDKILAKVFGEKPYLKTRRWV